MYSILAKQQHTSHGIGSATKLVILHTTSSCSFLLKKRDLAHVQLGESKSELWIRNYSSGDPTKYEKQLNKKVISL